MKEVLYVYVYYVLKVFLNFSKYYGDHYSQEEILGKNDSKKVVISMQYYNNSIQFIVSLNAY